MIIVITYIRLKSVWKFFALADNARKVISQMKKCEGYQGHRARGMGKLHYTMSWWKDEASMKQFARSGAHLEAMKKSATMAVETGSYTFEAGEVPGWKTARELIARNGRVINHLPKVKEAGL